MTGASTSATVDDFRRRARTWLATTMPRQDVSPVGPGGANIYDRARELQRMIWDGGFAGIRWPAEYGGLGLSEAHQRAFTEEAVGYEMPYVLDVPTFGILAATLLDFGTPEQKARHIPAILRGEELWVQFLSEPTGGSDLAGCVTRADRDGDTFVINGSKIWSSGALSSDWAMCLARTNWDVPKHRGLTMFLMAIHQPGVQVESIRQINGARDFCQEFFDDVSVPVTAVIGEIDDGWSVASRLLLHERAAVGGASPYTSARSFGVEHGHDRVLVRLAADLGMSSDPHVRQLVAGQHVEALVSRHLAPRVAAAIERGVLPPPAGSILKLSHAVLGVTRAETALEIGGSALGVFPTSDAGELHDRLGREFLDRQAMCLGGGSNEIQRNIISERVLGMPREWAADRDVPYRDVRHNTMPSDPI